ncbi:lipase member J isoform X3 [Rhipicephalus microplus]|uniref:lipase member J isoform X3 n=1 Tax=Rhipicephalus microplus TaxID=6941 RepID=UPI003F6B5D7E
MTGACSCALTVAGAAPGCCDTGRIRGPARDRATRREGTAVNEDARWSPVRAVVAVCPILSECSLVELVLRVCLVHLRTAATGRLSNAGFLLADAGYDVWLANLRGTPYARQHLHLTEKDTEYWNFGLDEVGLYDIPALVDYVLAWTGWSELFYVGFSQGNAAAWVTLSEMPEYNDKIRLLLALAPIGNVTYLRSPARRITSWSPFLTAALVKLNRGRVLVREPSLRHASYTVCDTTTQMRYFCSTPGFYYLGVNHNQLNVTRLPVYMAHYPSGASQKNMEHFFQIRRAKQFRKYSYGVWGNLERYGHPVAPRYDLSRVRVPVAMFSSLADYLAPPEDVAALRANLWHVLVYDYVVPDPNFSHLDFVLGFRVYDILYKPMIELLDVWSRDYLLV